MRRSFAIMAFAPALVALVSPGSFARSQSERIAPTSTIDLGFDGLSGGTAFKTYKAHGFAVRSSTSGWLVSGDFGNPAPMIEFDVPAGTRAGKAVTVTEAGNAFSLDSIDIYSSIAPVRWEFVGELNGKTLYTDKGEIPNPMGGFTTVDNPDSSTSVDTVKIKITGLKVCCDNPVGLDNIIVEK